MEISPIAGIRAMPVMKVPKADPELSAVFDIENFARIQDDSYSPNDARSGSGMEEDLDEFDELVEYDASAEDNEAALSVYAAQREPDHHLSFFA